MIDFSKGNYSWLFKHLFKSYIEYVNFLNLNTFLLTLIFIAFALSNWVIAMLFSSEFDWLITDH